MNVLLMVEVFRKKTNAGTCTIAIELAWTTNLQRKKATLHHLLLKPMHI